MDNKSKWLFGPRKTTNRPGFDMGNHENALNDCYIVDKKAMWRNFGDEHDARDVIRACAKTMGVKIGNCDPETFDFVLYNWLEDGLEEKNGVLALLYRLLWSKSELHTKLKRYEDAEERGEIGRVPRWIPVTERMPEDDYVPGDKTVQIKVMVCNVNNGSKSIRTLTRCWDRWLSRDGNVREWKWRWTWSKNVRDNEITHWMPLFELPKVVE